MLEIVNSGSAHNLCLVGQPNPLPIEHTSSYLKQRHLTILQFVLCLELVSTVIRNVETFIQVLNTSVKRYIRNNFTNVKFERQNIEILSGQCEFVVTRYRLNGCDNLDELYKFVFREICKMIGAQSYKIDESRVYAKKYFLVKFDNKPGIYIPTHYLENKWHISHFSIADLMVQNSLAYECTFSQSQIDTKHKIINDQWLKSNIKSISAATISLCDDATYSLMIR